MIPTYICHPPSADIEFLGCSKHLTAHLHLIGRVLAAPYAERIARLHLIGRMLAKRTLKITFKPDRIYNRPRIYQQQKQRT